LGRSLAGIYVPRAWVAMDLSRLCDGQAPERVLVLCLALL
jgi:hypothetical protein